MQITRGKIVKGLKFCVYGPEGIGKSTFVSHIPGVVYIDTEGSTASMDVPRLPRPTSWQMLLQEAEYVRDHTQEFGALVIDTADWAERLCMDAVCAAHPINGKPMQSIEDAGYGKGYVYLYEEFGRLLNIMQEIAERGVHVGFTAHAMMRKFEQPDELGAYDRWELKMSKKVAPLIKEWVDLLLFANYKTFVYASDDKGKKHKASGGQRVMYTNHHPCWDAKNRQGLPEEMPFDFAQVAELFAPIGADQAPEIHAEEQLPIPAPAAPPQPAQDTPAAIVPDNPPPERNAPQRAPEPQQTQAPEDAFQGIPPALADLMWADGIRPIEVQAAVAQRGYFPLNTPWGNYPPDFVQGVLIGAWPQVRQMCLDNRENTPF